MTLIDALSGSRDDGLKHSCATWKGSSENVARPDDQVVIRLRLKHQQGRGNDCRPPSKPLGRSRRLSLIPVHRPFDLANIVDLGLDFDNQENPQAWVEDQDVDPAAAAIVADLDFALDQPAASREPPRDLRGAARMHEVRLWSDRPRRVDL